MAIVYFLISLSITLVYCHKFPHFYKYFIKSIKQLLLLSRRFSLMLYKILWSEQNTATDMLLMSSTGSTGNMQVLCVVLNFLIKQVGIHGNVVNVRVWAHRASWQYQLKVSWHFIELLTCILFRIICCIQYIVNYSLHVFSHKPWQQ